MRTVDLLHKHGVAFNTLSVVHRRNVEHAREVYRFLKRIGSGFIQFIPLVERAADGKGRDHAICGPPTSGQSREPVTQWSVPAKSFGDFLVTIFDEWVRHDIGQVFVQLFDVMLGAWYQGQSSLCVFAETCGNALVLEHDGSLYACDHYVYPSFKRGSIIEQPLAELARSEEQRQFGYDKRDGLPDQCRACRYQFACNGACPKHRFSTTSTGQPGLNYLCPAYMRFFQHSEPFFTRMCQLLQAGMAPATIAQEIRQAEADPYPGAKPNRPCPCGSGKAYKRCHGARRGR